MRYLSYICRCKSVIIHFQPFYNNDEQRIDPHSDDVFRRVVKTCFQKYVTFKGRARRSEYWWFWLLNLIVSIVTLVLDYKLDMINIEFGIGALSGLYTLIVFLPSLAVSVRRLHDTGHSGWYYLLTFIPILGALFLLYFFVSDSAPEENRYGKSPKYAQETF